MKQLTFFLIFCFSSLISIGEASFQNTQSNSTQDTTLPSSIDHNGRLTNNSPDTKEATKSSSPNSINNSKWYQNPWIAGIAGFLGGLVIGFTISQQRKRKDKTKGKTHQLPSSNTFPEIQHLQKIQNAQIEIKDLKNALERVKRDLDLERQFNSENNRSKLNITEITADGSTKDSSKNNTENPTLILEPEKRCYAPAPDDPFIEQTKVYDKPSPFAPVMLIINPKNPEKAEFEFSPHADQGHIINTSIGQLDQFFEYTLPSKGFTKISNASRGSLILENGRWVRKTKARLNLQ